MTESNNSYVQASQWASNFVYVVGKIGYDFGTEACYDSFVQNQTKDTKKTSSKKSVDFKNPADFVAYLTGDQGKKMYKASRVIWIIKQNDIPIYALRPLGSFADETYRQLVSYLGQQEVKKEIERISVPGYYLSDSVVKLQSGQIVPVIIPELDGMSAWNIYQQADNTGIENFFAKIFDELQNKGIEPADRAINFTATNIFHMSTIFKQEAELRHVLNTIEAEPAILCRPGSNCWVVEMTFCDPKALLAEPRKVYQRTVDISEVIPVTIDETMTWSVYDVIHAYRVE